MISPGALTETQKTVLYKTVKGVHYWEELSQPERSAADYLSELGLCYTKPFSEPIYRCTESGKSLIALMENKANDKAEKKRQQRLQNQFSVASILVPCITFALGLIVEYFTEIVSLFLNIFR